MKLIAILITLLPFTVTCAQTKIVTGAKHAIFVDIPKGWVEAKNESLPLFLKPAEPNVSESTYMYVYGIDYAFAPDINGWIKGDVDDFKSKHPGMKVDSIALPLANLKANVYATGRYKTVVYTYENKTKQAILVIEGKNTIATVVLSAKDNEEFARLLPAFKTMAGSVILRGGSIKIEVQ